MSDATRTLVAYSLAFGDADMPARASGQSHNRLLGPFGIGNAPAGPDRICLLDNELSICSRPATGVLTHRAGWPRRLETISGLGFNRLL